MDRHDVHVAGRMGLVSLRFAAVAEAGSGRGLPAQGRLQAQAIFAPLPDVRGPTAMAVDRQDSMFAAAEPSPVVDDLVNEVTDFTDTIPFGAFMVPGAQPLSRPLLDLAQDHIARVGPHQEGDGILVMLRPLEKLREGVLPWLRAGLPQGEPQGTWVFVRVPATPRQFFDYGRGSLDRLGTSVPRGSRHWQDTQHGFIGAVLRRSDTGHPYAILVSDLKHLDPMGLFRLQVPQRSLMCTGRGALLGGVNHCEGSGCATRYICSPLCRSCPDGRSIPQVRRSGSAEIEDSLSLAVFEQGIVRIDPSFVGCAAGVGSLTFSTGVDLAGWTTRPPAQLAWSPPRMAWTFETRAVGDLPQGTLGPLRRHASVWREQQGPGGIGALAALFEHRGGAVVPEGHLLVGLVVEAFSGKDENGAPVRSARLVWWSRALPDGFGTPHRMLCSSPRVPVEAGCLWLLQRLPLTVPDGFALTSLCLSVADVDGTLMASLTAWATLVSGALVAGWETAAR